jgi:biopolymer transport protein ExbD
MSWQVRHEGSPNVTTLPSPQKVLEGISEGVWEITDEVRGPGETQWRAIEAHPVFEEALADYEPPKPKVHPDETHLDMNPLIDVALVLLIFFILTTSYDAIRTMIDMPSFTRKGQNKVNVIQDAKVLNQFVRVEARPSADGESVIYKVDGTEVPEAQLWQAIAVGVSQDRKKMIIDAQDVTWDSVIQIIAAGKKAQVTDIKMRVKE